MSSELEKMFNQEYQELPTEVIECFEAAESYVVEYSLSNTIQMTHIVCTYMATLANKLKFTSKAKSRFFSKSYPILSNCFIPVEDYLKKAGLKRDHFKTKLNCRKRPKISTELTEFANLYNLFSPSYTFDFETFYMLLLYYSKYLSKTSDSIYIPSGNIEFLEDLSLLDFLTDNIGFRGFRDPQKFFDTETQLLDTIYVKTCNTKNTEYSTCDKMNAEYSTSINVPYMTDLTYQMYTGELSTTFVGRENELHRLINILCKKNKNNPVLIGEPGVGKTALVYALAGKLVTNKISSKLQNYHILEFDITSTVAGAKYCGDFEERIKKSLDEIVKLTHSGKKIIICIDEIHTIVAAGAAEGALDLASILKPFLLNQSIKIIGTSTFKDFRTIESDKALERRFDTITIDEPSFDETVAILTGVKESMEEFHNLTITDSTIESVVTLSKRYIPERHLPDKAIDLLDEACAIKANLSTKSEVLPDDVCVAISIKKGIPVHKVQDAYDLINLESVLNSKIIGQKHVSASLAKAVRRTKAGLNDENRPLASFMFVGPTGVGKTETAKTLADNVFSGRDNIIRFDMSEYVEEHSVSKLIGSPPGYAGYKESGLLTEQVRRNPYSLVLFDEVEKSHPRVCNILLQILDEGSLTDSTGQHINFKNTIIILTSNIGASELAKQTVGFSDCLSSKSKSVLSDVKKAFSPEFLNRLDDIIQFNSLSEEDIYEIAKLHISNLTKKVNSLNIKVDISDEVVSRIARLAYSPEYGARELRRTIDQEIKNPLSDLILQNDVESISIRVSDGQIKVSQKEIISV